MENRDLKMEDIGEFGFIRSILDGCQFSSEKLIRGIGDDCAVIGPYEGRVFLITADLLLEDIHFILGRIPPEHLGEKALSVNLSDIAAMGGKALHALISVAVPKHMSVEILHRLYRGIKLGCRRYGVNILGGDTSASPDRLMINVTVIGEAPEKEVVYRSGAGPGDGIYVTGTIGDSAAGLKLIMKEATAGEPVASVLREAHNRPVPFLEAGRMISGSGLASAMIDLSDGLVSDLRHICESSKVGARLSQTALPLSEELRTLAEINSFDPYNLAISGGEDYRLLITVKKKNAGAFLKMFEKGAPCQIYRVGEITENDGIEIIRPDRTIESLDGKGFDHFFRA